MEKTNLHSRNKHRAGYDFAQLKKSTPELANFIIKNKFNGNDTIDFSNPEGLKLLNRALLKSEYGIHFWDIPKNYLCPPVPGRVDYLHYAADLLKSPGKNEALRVLDIGTGANCIYPLLGESVYGWKFVGAEIDEGAFQSAKANVEKNNLQSKIEIRRQNDRTKIFQGIILPNEQYDLTVCNPPFHSSKEEAQKGTARKNKNLKTKERLNFGGQAQELWCEGGEGEFIKKMILESVLFKDQVKWFSTLVSSKDNLSGIYGELKRNKALKVETVEMSQGQKISRFVAWSFKGE
nr:23S rRNA (adenine(1618)-N(6))-methyltransferase RlmF [Bacteriovorax sp. HI3]